MGKRLLTLEEIQKIETAMLAQAHRICKKHAIKYSLICGSTLGAVRHGGPIPWDSDADIQISYDDFDRFCQAMIEDLPDWAVLDGYKTGDKGYYRYFPRVALKGVSSIHLHLDIFPHVGLPDSRELQDEFGKKSEKLRKMYQYKEKPLSVTIYQSRNRFVWFGKKVVELIAKIALLPISTEKIYRETTQHFSQYPYKDAKYVMNPAGHYGMKNVLDKHFFENLIETDYDGVKVCIQRDYDEYLTHYYGDWRTPVKCEASNAKVYVDEDLDLSNIIGE